MYSISVLKMPWYKDIQLCVYVVRKNVYVVEKNNKKIIE